MAVIEIEQLIKIQRRTRANFGLENANDNERDLFINFQWKSVSKSRDSLFTWITCYVDIEIRKLIIFSKKLQRY